MRVWRYGRCRCYPVSDQKPARKLSVEWKNEGGRYREWTMKEGTIYGLASI